MQPALAQMGNDPSAPIPPGGLGQNKPASRRGSATAEKTGTPAKVEGASAASVAAGGGEGGSAAASSVSPGLKLFTRKQVAEEASASFDDVLACRRPLLVIIHNDVYDLGPYLQEHPGGSEALLDYAGRDATSAFDDIGHSSSARRVMLMFRVGTLVAMDRIK